MAHDFNFLAFKLRAVHVDNSFLSFFLGLKLDKSETSRFSIFIHLNFCGKNSSILCEDFKKLSLVNASIKVFDEDVSFLIFDISLILSLPKDSDTLALKFEVVKLLNALSSVLVSGEGGIAEASMLAAHGVNDDFVRDRLTDSSFDQLIEFSVIDGVRKVSKVDLSIRMLPLLL
jgi:hypothetical protein